MRIGVLSSPTSWHFQDLNRAAGRDHKLESLEFDHLCGSLTAAKNGGPPPGLPGGSLGKHDCLLVRSMPAGSLEQVVIRMDLLDQYARSGIRIVNSAKSIESAVDKYLCLCRLSAAGIPVPDSYVFQKAKQASDFFAAQKASYVFKPLFGSVGKGLELLEQLDQAKARFQLAEQNEKVIYLQHYIDSPHRDLRLFVIGDDVTCMARSNDNDWRKNIQLGGRAVPYLPTAHERELAIESARAIGVEIAGVDLLISDNEEPFVIEVNSSPGWQTLSRVSHVDIASKILAYLENLCS